MRTKKKWKRARESVSLVTNAFVDLRPPPQPPNRSLQRNTHRFRSVSSPIVSRRQRDRVLQQPNLVCARVFAQKSMPASLLACATRPTQCTHMHAPHTSTHTRTQNEASARLRRRGERARRARASNKQHDPNGGGASLTCKSPRFPET